MAWRSQRTERGDPMVPREGGTLRTPRGAIPWNPQRTIPLVPKRHRLGGQRVQSPEASRDRTWGPDRHIERPGKLRSSRQGRDKSLRRPDKRLGT